MDNFCIMFLCYSWVVSGIIATSLVNVITQLNKRSALRNVLIGSIAGYLMVLNLIGTLFLIKIGKLRYGKRNKNEERRKY
jgi:hypothetical protein